MYFFYFKRTKVSETKNLCATLNEKIDLCIRKSDLDNEINHKVVCFILNFKKSTKIEHLSE